MCDNCKCNENIENMEETAELSSEEMELNEQYDETVDDRCVELELYKETQRLEREESYFETLPFVETQDDTFNEIIRDGEAYASFYSHLVLAGVHSDTASQLLMNYMTTRHNLEISKMDIEKAKYQSIQISNNTL